MKSEIITYVLGPLVTLIVGWIGKGGWDKYAKNKEKMSALSTQQKVIEELYIKLANYHEDATKKVNAAVAHVKSAFEIEMKRIREESELERLRLENEIKKYRDNCDCPDEVDA